MEKSKKIIVGILIILLSVLTFIVKTNDVLQIDKDVYTGLMRLKNPILTNIIIVFTNFGGTMFITFLCILSIFIFKKKIYPILITVNILNVVCINQILKYIIQRSRPIYLHLVEENGYSFPSGHSMAALGYYGFLIFLINNSNFDKKIKLLLTIILIIVIILVGITRIYLGVHYFTDVIAGFITSGIYLIIFTNYIKKYLKHE